MLNDVSRCTVESILEYNRDTGIFRWRISRGKAAKGKIAGKYDQDGYVKITYRGKSYMAHRLAWLLEHGEWPKCQIDHKNGKRDDNRIANLRLADGSQNMWNSVRPKNNKSGIKGVSWAPHLRKWHAGIRCRGKAFNLGNFESKEDAALAYKRAAARLHGEFARLD